MGHTLYTLCIVYFYPSIVSKHKYNNYNKVQ